MSSFPRSAPRGLIPLLMLLPVVGCNCGGECGGGPVPFSYFITDVRAELSTERPSGAAWDADGTAPDTFLVLGSEEDPKPGSLPLQHVLTPQWPVFATIIPDGGIRVRILDADDDGDDVVAAGRTLPVTTEDLARGFLNVPPYPGVTALRFRITLVVDDPDDATALYWIRATRVAVEDTERAWDADGTPPDLVVTVDTGPDSPPTRNLPVSGFDVALPESSRADVQWGPLDGTATLTRASLLQRGLVVTVTDHDGWEVVGDVTVDVDLAAHADGGVRFTWDGGAIQALELRVGAEPLYCL